MVAWLSLALGVLSLLSSLTALVILLTVRAAVAELRASIAERQEERCRECRKEFVARREFRQFQARFGEEVS